MAEEGDQDIYKGYQYNRVSSTVVTLKDMTDEGRKVGLAGSGSSGSVIKVQIGRNLFIGKRVRSDLINPSSINIGKVFMITDISRASDVIAFANKKRLMVKKETLEKWAMNFEKSQVIRGKFTDENGSYVLMDFLQSSKSLPEDSLTKILYYLHILRKAGIAHCDVAPRNWILTQEGPILIDFGIATKFEEFNDFPMPLDVTPKSFNIDDRGLIGDKHDLKGFYLSFINIFGLPVEESIMSKLDDQTMTHDELTLELIEIFKPEDHVEVQNSYQSETKDPEQVELFTGTIEVRELLYINDLSRKSPTLDWVRRSNNLQVLKDTLMNSYIGSHKCCSLCCLCCTCFFIGCPCFCSVAKFMLTIEAVVTGKATLSDVAHIEDELGPKVYVRMTQ